MTIIHIDMDAFFASVAEIFHPEYKTKPMVVAVNASRSVVSTANYVARKYGIKSAMPLYKAKLLCPNLIICNPEFRMYQKYHETVLEVIKKYFTDKIELSSIDEWYVDITKLCKNKEPNLVALNIQKKIFEETKLTCSIGISDNKFLAKMASDINKPNGICSVYKQDLIHKIWPLDIGKMYMVGSATEKLLKNNNIFTIGDLATTDKNKLKKILKNRWEVLHNWANGKGANKLTYTQELPKSFSCGSTFKSDDNDYDFIADKIEEFSKVLFDELLRYNMIGKTLTLSIKTPDFKITNKSITKSYVDNLDEMIYEFLEIYEKYFSSIKLIRAITLKISNLKMIDNEK